VVKACGLEVVSYPYYDKASTSIRFDAMMEALNAARQGDVVLLHGCCHNPTGADLDAGQWAEVTRVVAERGLFPFVDFAYQGLGEGLEEDSAGMRQVVEAADEALVAHSCDKNFGVYRDRVGSLWVKTGSKDQTATAFAHLNQQTREAWSMPPDHGGAVVRIVLEDPELRADWKQEVDSMRARLRHLRDLLAAIDPRLAYIARQHGMFSMLPITPEQVKQLREEHAIYMADSGRFNICGLADHEIEGFGKAVLGVMG
jgi:aspartate/tyrosine/aromatic aminotransferase